jgi:hypothetical protein
MRYIAKEKVQNGWVGGELDRWQKKKCKFYGQVGEE